MKTFQLSDAQTRLAELIDAVIQGEEVIIAKHKKPVAKLVGLAKLAEDSDKHIRWGVAENPNTPAEILVKLAQDNDKHVRWGVAENPSTPAEVLAKLAQDDDKHVRLSVAENPNTSAEVLAQLVTETPQIPTEVLADSGVRKLGFYPIDLVEDLLEPTDEDIVDSFYTS